MLQSYKTPDHGYFFLSRLITTPCPHPHCPEATHLHVCLMWIVNLPVESEISFDLLWPRFLSENDETILFDDFLFKDRKTSEET